MNKLKIQDFISVGIYTAIYFLIIVLGMTLLRLTLPGYGSILIPSVTALFSGLIYLLLLHRIPRFGAITIMGSIMGIFFLVSGHFPLSFVPNILCAIGADLIQYRTKLSDKIRTFFSYIVFSFGLSGPVLPLWFMKNAYIDSLVARGKDSSYINSVFAHITTGSFFLSFGAIIILGIIGLIIGQKLYQKHFAKTNRKETESFVREI